jgi:hypothetical protein
LVVLLLGSVHFLSFSFAILMKSLFSFLALFAGLGCKFQWVMGPHKLNRRIALPAVVSQDDVPESLTEPKTGIKFTAYPLEEQDTPEGSRIGTLGLVYPSNLTKNEYIGHLVRFGSLIR